MARIAPAKTVKRICEVHSERLSRLNDARALTDLLAESVVEACNDIANNELLKILRTVPVEEFNRNKAGIRTKTLHDAGIHTMADVVAASRILLENINGISEDASFTIKKAADNYVQQALSHIKIKLSIDNPDECSASLVRAVYRYHKSVGIPDRAEKLLKDYESEISRKIGCAQPAGTVFKWIVTGKSAKEQAEEAYCDLANLLYGDYGTASEKLVRDIDDIFAISEKEAWNDFSINSISYFTTLEKICPGLVGADDSRYGLPEDLAGEIQKENLQSAGLKCSLRGYQTWGVKYILHQGRVLLGDEMGLGKTIQAIAAMVSLYNTGARHFLVVCPASVLANWCREVAKHSTLSVYCVHGEGRLDALLSWEEKGGVAVTSYETTGYFDLREDFGYSMLVVDEAHYIKNPEAKRTQNVIKLSQKADRLLFMTGTALENRVDEMINLIKILNPDTAKEIAGFAFMAAASQFREKVAPVYYRRKREDVLMELPDLIESREWCTLTPEEESTYEASVLSKDYTNVRRVSWNIDDLSKSSKAERLTEIIEEAKTEGRKILVFSFYLDTIRRLYDFLGNRCLNPITGALTPQRRQEIIDEFDKAPAGTVLLSQIQSGGTGLNIQAASVVVICEPQFKPSVENQAIARAYRMGQSRNVLVYRLLSDDTVDERIIELLENKQAVFDAFADKSVAADNTPNANKQEIELDESSFGTIIEEEITRIKEKNQRK